MKNQDVQKDIQLAVKDYVDQLINDRTGRGKGMALSSNELMTAARKAGNKTHVTDASSTYLTPAISFIQEHINVNKTDRLTKRDTAKPSHPLPTTKSSKSKREPHWLQWKTGKTPVPPSVESRPPSVVFRPDTALSLARNPTPALAQMSQPAPVVKAPSPDLELLKLLSPEPEHNPPTFETRPLSVAPRIPSAVPRAQSVSGPRKFTPAPPRIETPGSLKADHRDPFYDRQVAPANVVLKSKPGQDPAYMPALKAWVTNANDYERDVAFNLMQVLSTNSCPPQNKARARSAAANHGLSRMAAGTRRNIPRTAGVKTSYPAAWQQVYRDPHSEQYIVNNMTKSLERQEPHMNMGGQQDRPLHRRYQRSGDFIHKSSCFMNSQLPYKSMFVINPEWVSEHKASRKSAQMLTNGPNSMKYAST